jgi:hypothetical protein
MSATTTLQRLTCTALVALGLTATAPSADAKPSAGQEASASGKETDSSPSPIFRFRSVGMGYTPHQNLEVDVYILPKWAAGVGVTGGGGDRYDCNSGRCWRVTGGTLYAERLFFLGDRWAHFGLRGGLFGTEFYSKTFAYARDGERIVLDGVIVGPSVGASLNVTAFRWGAVTLNMTGMPGLFFGEEAFGWPNRSTPDEPMLAPRTVTRPAFTATVSLGLRFGNLDGRGLTTE